MRAYRLITEGTDYRTVWFELRFDEDRGFYWYSEGCDNPEYYEDGRSAVEAALMSGCFLETGDNVFIEIAA